MKPAAAACRSRTARSPGPHGQADERVGAQRGQAERGRARLPLGKEAVARIRGKLERQLTDLETTRDLALSTA